MQQEAARKLGFSVIQTMMVAQKLYEAGKISYMRTDSVNLSDEARSGAENQIKSAFGKEFHQPRVFKTKSSGAQEAHEAIRPTDFSVMDPRRHDPGRAHTTKIPPAHQYRLNEKAHHSFTNATT